VEEDGFLFDVGTHRIAPGRVRRGLDRQVKEARTADIELPAGRVALLRTLADQIDQLERFCRTPKARPYDRIPLTGMAKQYDDTYRSVFAALDRGTDPFAAAIAALLDADRAAADHPERPEPPALG
jgi:hypothetical protein